MTPRPTELGCGELYEKVWAQPDASTSASARRLDSSDVDLLHRHHRLECAFGLDEARVHRWEIVPGERPRLLRRLHREFARGEVF